MSTQTNRDFALVVDDSPETLRVLTDSLEEAGLIVIVALTGEKAIELAERMAPDIILMDAVMPGLDGFETCRRLKQRKELAHVPVIFMTGLTETEHIIKGLQAGGVDYVTKPIVPDELIARIGVHIANARLAQSARAALDAAGRSLMAVTRDLEVRWCTPQAAVLCDRAGFAGPDGGLDSAAAREGLGRRPDRRPAAAPSRQRPRQRARHRRHPFRLYGPDRPGRISVPHRRSHRAGRARSAADGAFPDAPGRRRSSCGYRRASRTAISATYSSSARAR